MMIDDAAYDLVCRTLRDSAGIALDETKKYLVETRLLPVARGEGVDTVADLIAELRRRPRHDLRTAIVEALTTNETSFFRDPPVFEVLARQLVPALMRSRQKERRLRIWSAACSTGQEPYSVAMALHEAHPELFGSGWQLEILATDVNQQVLDRARDGRFRAFEVQRGLDARRLRRFFEAEPDGSSRVVEAIRRVVEFRGLNLIEQLHDLPTMDVVLMRNVLIYFDLPTKEDVLWRVRDRMASDGKLILGAMEMLIGIRVPFQTERLGGVAVNEISARFGSGVVSRDSIRAPESRWGAPKR